MWRFWVERELGAGSIWIRFLSIFVHALEPVEWRLEEHVGSLHSDGRIWAGGTKAWAHSGLNA